MFRLDKVSKQLLCDVNPLSTVFERFSYSACDTRFCSICQICSFFSTECILMMCVLKCAHLGSILLCKFLMLQKWLSSKDYPPPFSLFFLSLPLLHTHSLILFVFSIFDLGLSVFLLPLFSFSSSSLRA